MLRLCAWRRQETGIMAAAGLAAIVLAACATPAGPQQVQPASTSITSTVQASVAAAGPVRNETRRAGDEIVTIRYWKIRKGTFPEFLKASEEGVWPYFEKIGARIVGMWQVIPAPGESAPSDYDEVYLTTRYASMEHWAATREAARLGGDGPDFEALQAALEVRRSLTIETKVTYLRGVTGPLGPIYLPGTGEKFAPVAGDAGPAIP